MSFCDNLYDAAAPIWAAQLNHPFVRGIGDGSLEEERFKRWVLQDYLYLHQFVRVIAWAVAKSDGLEQMRWYASALTLTLETEMQLHRDYAARFGISPEDLEGVPIWPTTRAYTDFLVRTAADGEMADLVAALLPCAWGYVYLAERLAQERLPGDERYADWIRQYSSDEFRQASDWLRSEMDRLAAGIGLDKRRRLTHLFVLSSRYEWRFWQMCWEGEAWGV